MRRPLLCLTFAAVSLVSFFSSTAFAQYACGGDPVCQAEAEGREAQRLGCAKHEGERMRACIRAGHEAERKKSQAQWEADAPKRAEQQQKEKEAHDSIMALPTRPVVGSSEYVLSVQLKANAFRNNHDGFPDDDGAEQWDHCTVNTTTTARGVRKQYVCKGRYLQKTSYVYTENGVVTAIQE